jgi:hypothetical protein
MMKAVQNSLFSAQVPVKDIMEIGLRSTAALAQICCEAEGRLGTLQIGFLRSAVNSYSQATRQLLAGQPTGDADATVEAMKHTMSYWRSLAGLMATHQAEVADLMDSSLQEMAELTDDSSRKDSPLGPAASLPMALFAATGASMLTTAQAMCKQIGQSARQFTASNGGQPDLAMAASNEQEGGQSRTRSYHRKAAA